MLLRSSRGFLSRSYGVLVGDSLRSHDAFTVLPRRTQCMHCAFKTFGLRFHDICTELTRFQDAVTSQRTPYNLRAKATDDRGICTGTLVLYALCTTAELLMHCRRPYCPAMVTLQGPHCALIRTPSDSVCFEHAQCVPLFSVLCDPTASTGDATGSLRQCLRSYCVHLGVLHFSRTPWDRPENTSLV